MRRVIVVVLAVAASGTACFEVKPPPKPPKDPTAVIAGTVGVDLVNGSHAADLQKVRRAREQLASARGQPLLTGNGLAVTGVGDRGESDPVEKEFHSGDAMVHFERRAFDKHSLLPVLERMKHDAGFGDVKITVDNCNFRVVCKLTLIDDKGFLDEERTSEFCAAMTAQKRQGIRSVFENIRHHGMLIPNDPLASLQWHYDAIRLPPAWDITVGDPELVVAVVDSGIKHGNPDLRAKIARDPNNQNQFVEFDFVSTGDLELDNIAGIDLDAEDPGDSLFAPGDHSYHGTHVAGTIGAVTDNRSGVAGILWEAQIVAVRVLGAGLGGNFSDILNGLQWAVGDTDPGFDIGQPVNQRPARIVNLSLGAGDDTGSLTATWQAVVDEILDDPESFIPKEIVLVVAAGNDGRDARGVTPANIERVITVGATRFDGQRAEYSNFGPAIDIVAPGGDGGDANNDGNPDLILSTWDNDVKLEQGTSMSAPHVTGVAGLMVSAKPNLTHDQVHDLLRTTANATFRCNEGCGTGLLDAVQALIIAGAELDPAPRLSVDSERLLFPGGISRLQMRVLNLGNVAAPFAASLGEGDADLFAVSPGSGVIPAGGSTTLTIDLARGGATDGAAEIRITGTDAAVGQEVIVVALFQDIPARGELSLDTIEVGAFIRDDAGTLTAAGSVAATRANGFVYEITGLKAGVYEVYGVGDDNHDGIFDAQLESLGAYPLTDGVLSVIVEDNDTRVEGIDFNVSLRSTFALEGGVGSVCTEDTSDVDCAGIDFAPGASCISTFVGGYCSRLCGDDDLCGVTAVCSRKLQCDGQNECAVCLQRCVSDVQCRDGYLCDRFGTCTPEGFAE